MKIVFAGESFKWRREEKQGDTQKPLQEGV